MTNENDKKKNLILLQLKSSRNFQCTKFSGFGLFLTDGRNLSGTRSKSVNCRFSFSAARNVINEYITFGFPFPYIGFLPLLGKFERHCLRAILIFSVFKRPLSEKIPTNDLRLRMAMNGRGMTC